MVNFERSEFMRGNTRGRGNIGKVVSDETRDKIRLSNIGKKKSPETKQKISSSLMGNVHSIETKSKQSKSMFLYWQKRKEG